MPSPCPGSLSAILAYILSAEEKGCAPLLKLLIMPASVLYPHEDRSVTKQLNRECHWANHP